MSKYQSNTAVIKPAIAAVLEKRGLGRLDYLRDELVKAVLKAQRDYRRSIVGGN